MLHGGIEYQRLYRCLSKALSRSRAAVLRPPRLCSFPLSKDHASTSSTPAHHRIAGEFAENKSHENQQPERTGFRKIQSKFQSKHTKRARNRNGGRFRRIDARAGGHGSRQRLPGKVEPDHSSTLRKAYANGSIPDARYNAILINHFFLELLYKSCFDNSSCKISPAACIRERLGYKEN